MFSPDQENISTASTKAPVKYGELIVLGYNGSLPNGDRGRRKSRGLSANGVKPSTVHVACTPQAAKAISNKDQHSISYTLSRAQTVVVEYTHDSNTDMFQIGPDGEHHRGDGPAQPGDTRRCRAASHACRIIASAAPHTSKNIFLQGVRLGERLGGEGGRGKYAG
ncbi:hypothetical protein ANANG_G00051090 [Anguilla anguilla]|uniref:Pellino FHA domain-containing protein n=1 Tax=Anguilla anguilla TaxID=7936 RepID=A0A9D3SA92_ANGAN|nr:hypothetical protein ANANG_G00051090 [Anguilla anguilla]